MQRRPEFSSLLVVFASRLDPFRVEVDLARLDLVNTDQVAISSSCLGGGSASAPV